MAKQAQVLILEPQNELRFKGPFTDVVTAELKLKNPSEKKVCFKVKTTAPKRYCVRPNSGIIEPTQELSVSVMLQPFDYDPNEKNKHKFMVLTLFAPDGPLESQEALWKEAQPDQLMDSKLKCVFELPETEAPAPATKSVSEEKKVSASPEKTVFSSKPANIETDLRNTLAECQRLNEEVKQLRNENSKLKDEGVRLRKVAMSDTTSSTPAPSPSELAMAEPQASLPPIVYLIVAVILGLILGKFIL